MSQMRLSLASRSTPGALLAASKVQTPGWPSYQWARCLAVSKEQAPLHSNLKEFFPICGSLMFPASALSSPPEVGALVTSLAAAGASTAILFVRRPVQASTSQPLERARFSVHLHIGWHLHLFCRHERVLGVG